MSDRDKPSATASSKQEAAKTETSEALMPEQTLESSASDMNVVDNKSKAEITAAEMPEAQDTPKPAKTQLAADRHSVMLVIDMPVQEIPDFAKRDPNMSPDDRLKRWTDNPTPVEPSGSDHLTIAEAKLKTLAQKIQEETGQTSVIIVTAETLVVSLTESELQTVKAWPEIKSVVDNTAVKRR